MPTTGRTDPVTGLMLTLARSSNLDHLVVEGNHYTLCGRVALYSTRWEPRPQKCRRCQWEASQRAQETNDAG